MGGHQERTLRECYRCGYQIPCRRGVVCSECGLKYLDHDVEMLVERDRLVEGCRSRTQIYLAGWVVIWVVYSLAGMYLHRQFSYGASFFDGIEIPITLGIVIGSSLGFGWFACRFAPEHQRRLLWICWLRVLPIVHLSWLSIAGFTGTGVAFAILGRLVGGADSGGLGLLLGFYIAISFAIWLIGSFVLVAIWSAKLKELLEANLVVQSQPGVGMLWMVGIVLWVVGGGVGFAGGFLGTALILEMS